MTYRPDYDAARWALHVPIPVGTDVGVGRYVIRLVLVALAMHANEHDEAWPSYRTLGRELADPLTDREVRHAIRHLREAKLIEHVGSVGNGVNKWHLRREDGDTEGAENTPRTPRRRSAENTPRTRDTESAEASLTRTPPAR